MTGLVVEDDKVNVGYLVHQLNSKPFQQKLKPLLRGTTIKGVTKDDLLNLYIVVPDESKQLQSKSDIELLKMNISHSKNALDTSKSVQSSIIAKVF